MVLKKSGPKGMLIPGIRYSFGGYLVFVWWCSIVLGPMDYFAPTPLLVVKKCDVETLVTLEIDRAPL